MNKTIKLPKFKRQLNIYDDGASVRNPYSGACYTLNATELSVYDHIIGCQALVYRNGGPFSPMTREYQLDMRKGLDWFRKNNAEAYMVLLD